MMTDIFKYFLGVIVALLLIYFLIVLLRSVISSGVSTGADLVSDPNVQKNIASGTQSAVKSVTSFSLLDWMRNFGPFRHPPIEVVPEVSKGLESRYYTDNLRWQNLADSPSDHPTDYIPIPNKKTSDSIKPTDEYIDPFVKPNETIINNSIIHGRAYYKVFTLGKFKIYILDENGNTISYMTAYRNGDLKKSGWVPFRAVADLSLLQTNRGYLLFKNDNKELSGIRAVNLVPVWFAK